MEMFAVVSGVLALSFGVCGYFDAKGISLDTVVCRFKQITSYLSH